jgi:hypothetical protein
MDPNQLASRLLYVVFSHVALGDLNRAFSVSISTELSLKWFNDL